MRSASLLSVLLLATIALPGCHQNDRLSSRSRIDLLTESPWHYLQYVVDGKPIATPRDAIEFRRDGTSVLGDGGNRVPGSSWEFIDDETRILFNKGAAGQTSVEIVELSETSLIYRGATAGADGGLVPFEADLVH
jgi:hypothetical protein